MSGRRVGLAGATRVAIIVGVSMMGIPFLDTEYLVRDYGSRDLVEKLIWCVALGLQVLIGLSVVRFLSFKRVSFVVILTLEAALVLLVLFALAVLSVDMSRNWGLIPRILGYVFFQLSLFSGIYVFVCLIGIIVARIKKKPIRRWIIALVLFGGLFIVFIYNVVFKITLLSGGLDRSGGQQNCLAARDSEACLVEEYKLVLKNENCVHRTITMEIPFCWCSPEGKYGLPASAVSSCGIDASVLKAGGWRICKGNNDKPIYTGEGSCRYVW